MSERPTGTPRLLRTAVATSTLPLLVLGSAALAAPASADVPRQALTPRSATPVNIEMAQVRISSASLATSLPAAFVAPATTQAARTPATYTVRSGDTLSHIAGRHGIGLSKLLNANGLSASSVIHPGQKLKLSGIAPASQGAAPNNNLVPSSFLHYTYPDHVVASANQNKRALLTAGVPSRSQMQAIIADTARRMGVDPSLALAHAFVESSFNHASVSPANAIGAMQVIPSSGTWASELVGRKLNLLDPYDNATAGVAIIRQLQRNTPSVDIGIAAYYQGLGGVTRNGMYPDTKRYVAKIKDYMKRF